MSENTITRAATERAAIERWEDEGGRALAIQEPRRAPPGDLLSSDPEDELSFNAAQRAQVCS